MFFVSFFYVVCKTSNFNMWTAKHWAQASCTELTLISQHDVLTNHIELTPDIQSWCNQGPMSRSIKGKVTLLLILELNANSCLKRFRWMHSVSGKIVTREYFSPFLNFLPRWKKEEFENQREFFRPKVFLISYLLFWPAVIWRIFLDKKNSAGWLLKTKWLTKKVNIVIWKQQLCACIWKCKLSSATKFLEGNHLNFSSRKNFSKWQQVKITNMILQRP